MILSIYVKCLRSKLMPITQEAVKFWYGPNVILQGMGYTIPKYERARMWNKLNLSFKSSGSARKFKGILYDMEDDACECNSFNCVLCMLQRFQDFTCPMASFPFISVVSLYICIYFIDSSS